MSETRQTRTGAFWCALGLVTSLLALGCLAEDSNVKEEPMIEVRCGADLGLTPASGTIEDWAGVMRSWKAAVDGDIVTLTRRRSCGDECSITEVIVLAGFAETCPRFVSASSTRTDAGGALGPTSKTTRAAEGTLEIEEWNPKSGVVSGRLESEAEFTFFVSRAPAP
jgi:hypothetical protein